MTTVESKIKKIPFSQESIYNTLSDLNNLTQIQNRIPQDKVKELSFDTDAITMKVDIVGNIILRIINREPHKTLKFELEGGPSQANMWIQLIEVAPNDTRMKLTLKAKLNMMIKMALKGKLNEFINTLADALSQLNYSDLQK